MFLSYGVYFCNNNYPVFIMKLFVCSVSLLFCFLFSQSAQAQGTYTGCFLSSTNTVYTNELYPTYFLGVTGARPLSPGYCYWTPATGTPTCTVCTGGITYNTTTGAFISCNSPVAGVRNTFSMIYCPLDDNLWTIFLVDGFLGFLLIRNQKAKDPDCVI